MYLVIPGHLGNVDVMPTGSNAHPTWKYVDPQRRGRDALEDADEVTLSSLWCQIILNPVNAGHRAGSYKSIWV